MTETDDCRRHAVEDDCRRHAVECERLAEIANDPKIKHELRALAQAWLLDASELSDEIPRAVEHSANSTSEAASS